MCASVPTSNILLCSFNAGTKQFGLEHRLAARIPPSQFVYIRIAHCYCCCCCRCWVPICVAWCRNEAIGALACTGMSWFPTDDADVSTECARMHIFRKRIVVQRIYAVFKQYNFYRQQLKTDPCIVIINWIYSYIRWRVRVCACAHSTHRAALCSTRKKKKKKW